MTKWINEETPPMSNRDIYREIFSARPARRDELYQELHRRKAARERLARLERQA